MDKDTDVRIYRSLLFLTISFIGINLNAQKLNLGFGFEVNRMDLATKAPDVKVPYTIWYSPSIGLAAVASLEYEVTDYFSLNLNPSYGYYKMDWDFTWAENTFLKTNHLNLSIGSRFKFSSLTCGAELGLSRFTEIYHVLNDSYVNVKYSAANRSILTTSVFFGCHIYNQSYIYLKGTYYLDNLFEDNGFDNDGWLVGPVFQRPIIISAGLRVNLRVKG